MTWILKAKNFYDFKKKVFLMRGKCCRSTAILANKHTEGQVFFSRLASLSGFLKDAKSVYLKQRLLACVKRILMLYIRLIFILLCVFLFLEILCHMNYGQVLIFCFWVNYLFQFVFCAKGPL